MTSNVSDSKLAHFTRWSSDVMQRIIKGSLDPDAVMSAVQTLINKKTDKMENVIVITQSTISQMITAGNYDWVNGDVVKKFQFNPANIGTWEFKLRSADRTISSEKAKALCEEDGWQVAKLEHLLALGAAFPDLQKQNPIIALGSVCLIGGDRRVPELWFDDDGRKLVLRWWSYDWNASFPFLSVRKISDS